MTIEIPLTQGKVALIDDSDFECVSRFKWYAMRYRDKTSYYAVRSTTRTGGKRTAEKMHNVILGTMAGFIVDHINRNTLDNRRCNLRFATQAQNKTNTRRRVGSSRYIHVRFDKSCHNPWRAELKANGKRIMLGYFPTEEEAAHAADVGALLYHGEFAQLNFSADQSVAEARRELAVEQMERLVGK